MKRTQQKAFTLVELIVVITILAILGTIAFISLQGYGADAKNSKITSDLRNIASAMEAKRTQDSTSLSEFMSTPTTTNTVAASGNVTVWSGTTVAVNSNTATWAYQVWVMNFVALWQSGDDFKDPNENPEAEYVYGYYRAIDSTGEPYSGYQLAGQLVVNETETVRIKWNYLKVAPVDLAWLISATGNGTATGLVDDQAGNLR